MIPEVTTEGKKHNYTVYNNWYNLGNTDTLRKIKQGNYRDSD